MIAGKITVVLFVLTATSAFAVDAIDIEEIHELSELAQVCFNFRTNTFTDVGWREILDTSFAMSEEAQKQGLPPSDIRELESSGYNKARFRVDQIWTERSKVLTDCQDVFDRSQEVLRSHSSK